MNFASRRDDATSGMRQMRTFAALDPCSVFPWIDAGSRLSLPLDSRQQQHRPVAKGEEAEGEAPERPARDEQCHVVARQ